MQVSFATTADVDDIIRLGKQHYDLQGEAGFDEQYTKLVINGIIKHENGDYALFAVRDDDRKVVGYLYGFTGYTPYTPNKVAYIDLIFVEEAYRATDAADALMQKFLDWGRERGIVFFQASAVSDLERVIDRASKFFESAGFSKRHSAIYVRRIT